MLSDKLHIEIHERIRQTLRDPEIIIMHPDTSEEIFKSIRVFGKPHTNLSFHGYRVIRSEEVPINEFIIK